MKDMNMKWISILLLNLLFYSRGFSETKVLISSNVTRSDIPIENDFTTEKEKLATIISSDHGNKNFTLKVSFIDPQPYPSYIQWLVDWWNSVVGEGEEKPADIEILFSLTDQEKWKYEGIKVINKDLGENHLLPKVMDYIKQYVIANETDVNQLIKKWVGSLSKALDKTWLKALETESDAFSKRNKYNRDNNGWDWPMAYYEFIPYQDTQKDTLIIGKDTLITADYIIKQFEDQADRFRTLPEDFQDMLHTNFKGTKQRMRYLQLKKIKEIIEDYQKYHSSMIISDWSNTSRTGWTLATNPSGFRDRNAITDHLYMQKREVGAYASMPTMCWTQNYLPEHEEDIGKSFWKATRCNVFVGDFSEQILSLKNYPWGTKGWNANGIYTNLGGLPDFIELEWKEVWKYTNAGFPVYIVTPKLKELPAGHIAIAYKINLSELKKITNPESAQKNGKVVQAGSKKEKFGVLNLSDALTEDYFTNENCKAKAYLFLGYIKN